MNNTIDTSILPNVWLHWTTSKDSFYLNCANNAKQNYKPDIKFSWNNYNDVLYNAGSRLLFAYAKYHDDIQRLEIAGVTMDTRRTAESREWKYAGARYFIDKAKNVFDKDGLLVSDVHTYRLDDRHYAYTFKNFLQMFHRLAANHEKIAKEFHKFWGKETFTNMGGKTYEVKYTHHITEWYSRKQKSEVKTPRLSKEQKLTAKLTSIPLADASNFNEKYPMTSYIQHGYTYKVDGIVYFERVDDEWSVLRIFERTYCGGVRETERFYINDNGANRIVTPCYYSGWSPTRQVRDYSRHQFVNKEEAIEKCNRIKYLLPLFEDDSKIKRYLFNALRFPEVEQLIKLGYKAFALKIAESYTPKADLKEKFAYYNEKEKNLLRRIGLTKHQLDKHLSKYEGRSVYTYYHGNGLVLKEMRHFFGDDFAHLDNATFDRYYDAFITILGKIGYRGSLENKFCRIGVDEKKFIKNMVRLGEKNHQVYTMILDSINAYEYLDRGTHPALDWYFNSYSDVVRTHDALIALRVQQDAERRARYNASEAERMAKEEEKRKKLDEERKEYEYEDDNFIIRLPKTGTEITTEGIAQHICIGGYVSRHSTGQTNLFFLRKKSEPDVPFYAIEMNNSNHIVQIHGFGNKWLGNNPEAIPTVVRWLRKNNIKCDEKILTCVATGYGSVDRYCPMPVVD